jgi:hypothetical protein
MSTPAEDKAKRDMVVAALQRIASGKTLTRMEIFNGSTRNDEHKQLQKKVLSTLVQMGVLRRVPHQNPSVSLVTLHNGKMLDSVLKTESEITRLIWPNRAPAVDPPKETEDAIEESLQEEEETLAVVQPAQPPATVAAAPQQHQEALPVEIMKEVLNRQDQILEKVLDPLGENILWTRDRVVEMRKEQIEQRKRMDEQDKKLDELLEILRMLK